MKKLILLLTQLVLTYTLLAHPAIGIVKDSKGNIYYSDTEKIWKITPDSKRTIAVPNVHTHELFMDNQDNLFGEHLWYNGEQSNTWGHYVWCLKNTGEVIKVQGPAEGFLTDYSFIRDAAGNMYWVERFTTSRFKKKSIDGTITTIATGKFRDIRWMYATSEGIVYFIDFHDLYKIDAAGTITLLAKKLVDNNLPPYTPSSHDVFGIWTDKEGNVYCAITSDKVVKKVTPAGVITKIAFSTTPWTPTGGVFDNEGNLWLLECNAVNEQRARKISKEQLALPALLKPTIINNLIPAVSGIILLIAAVWLVRRFLVRVRCGGVPA